MMQTVAADFPVRYCTFVVRIGVLVAAPSNAEMDAQYRFA